MNGMSRMEASALMQPEDIKASARAKALIGGENDRAFEEVVGVTFDFLRQLQNEIRRVEALIDFAALVLRYAQPDIEGKVDVRWWHLNGRNPFRSPVMVRWTRAKTGKMAGRVAVPKKVGHLKGTFTGLLNGPVADAVAHEIKDLITYWTTLVHSIGSMNRDAGRRVGGYKRAPKKLEYKADRLMGLRDDLVKRMAKQGYPVPDAFEQARPVMPEGE